MFLGRTVMFAMAAGLALASPIAIEPRQVSTIKKALGMVNQALQDIDTAIMGLTTDPTSAVPILDATEKAQKTLAQAETMIKGADGVGLFQALSLQQTAGDLATQIQTTIGDLVAKKPVLDQLGVTQVAVDALEQQKTSSAGLGEALVSKIPAIGRPIAQQSAEQITKAVDDGIAALKKPPAAKPAAPAAPAPAPAVPATPATTAPKTEA